MYICFEVPGIETEYLLTPLIFKVILRFVFFF